MSVDIAVPELAVTENVLAGKKYFSNFGSYTKPIPYHTWILQLKTDSTFVVLAHFAETFANPIEQENHESTKRHAIGFLNFCNKIKSCKVHDILQYF